MPLASGHWPWNHLLLPPAPVCNGPDIDSEGPEVKPEVPPDALLRCVFLSRRCLQSYLFDCCLLMLCCSRCCYRFCFLLFCFVFSWILLFEHYFYCSVCFYVFVLFLLINKNKIKSFVAVFFMFFCSIIFHKNLYFTFFEEVWLLLLLSLMIMMTTTMMMMLLLKWTHTNTRLLIHAHSILL